MIAETDDSGQILQEYVYLNGLLVAVLTTESNSWEIIDPATSMSEGVVAVREGQTKLVPQDNNEKHYLKAINGDVTLVSQIAQLRKTEGVGKVGLVLSESPSSDAIQLKISVVTENDLIPIKRKGQFIPVLKEKSRALEISYRNTTGANLTTETYAYQGDWLKLDRQGDQIEVLTSSDGNQWTSVQSLNLVMASESYIGFSQRTGMNQALTSRSTKI